MQKRIFLIESNESHLCPDCEKELVGYDSRKRHIKKDNGEKEYYRLRRLRCNRCKKIHTELLDFMQPHKHYTADVIESQIDETRNDCPANDSTIHRWKKEFKENSSQINGALVSLWIRTYGSPKTDEPGDSLLGRIRSKGSGWLTKVTQILLKDNLWLPTQFAWCP